MARVTPEHKVSKTGYLVKVEIDESERVVKSVECQGCPASVGGCKHGIAFLFWLHRRAEEPSTTESICYWRKSELSKVGTSKKFILLTDLTSSANLELSDKDDFLSRVISSQISVTDSILLNIHREVEMANLSLHQLHILYTAHKSGQLATADEFLNFCSEKMTIADCKAATKATVEQSKSPLWYELKYGRITASKIYEASRCTKEDGTLVETIFGATKFPETIAMKRGILLESEVLKECEKKLGIKFYKCGLLLDPRYPVLGASPDAISEEYVVEIKCPYKEKTVTHYVKDEIINIKYLSQIQMQMYFCNKSKGLFVIADPNFNENRKINIYVVDHDINFCLELIDNTLNFWKKCIYNKLKQ